MPDTGAITIIIRSKERACVDTFSFTVGVLRMCMASADACTRGHLLGSRDQPDACRASEHRHHLRCDCARRHVPTAGWLGCTNESAIVLPAHRDIAPER